MQQQLTHKSIQQFLKPGVIMRFHEDADGWHDLLLQDGNKVAVISSNANYESSLEFSDKVPDWATKKPSKADGLPSVKAKDKRRFFMRSGELIGPINADRPGPHDKGEFQCYGDSGDTEYRWHKNGKFAQMYDSDEPHEFDLVEMVTSKVFD